MLTRVLLCQIANDQRTAHSWHRARANKPATEDSGGPVADRSKQSSSLVGILHQRVSVCVCSQTHNAFMRVYSGCHAFLRATELSIGKKERELQLHVILSAA